MLVATVNGVYDTQDRPKFRKKTYYEFELTDEESYIIANALYLAARDSVKYRDLLLDMYHDLMEGNSYGKA